MFKNILKGMLIGLANIIPGVSGGTLAVSMGLYDKIIHCISHFFSDIVKNLLFLLPILLGMGIAIVASSFGIDFLFETFPLQTNLLFIGLILGSLPAIYGKVKSRSIKVGYLVSALLFFAVVVGMALLNGANAQEKVIVPGVGEMLLLFLIGVLASATMVVPGVSGSMMLLVLGYYNPILRTIQEFVIALVHWDWAAMAGTFFILIPFGIGVVVGIIVIAKIIEVVFDKFPMYAYWSIMGLLIASPVAILMVGSFSEVNVVSVLTGALTFLLGWFISRKLGETE
ncbi:MAG: DUF368 domain-containing protein [Lachnospiraceae bacterium]|nr:DUF368 domain-containing protein [Lachnospiraceae bacterium]MDD6504189.1 DUF368 domain-containing protein [Lachnospiraceae bacterium]